MERSLVLVKPDGVQRGLVGEIIGRLERKGLKIIGLRLLWVPRSMAEEHYVVHAGKPFYPGLVEFITAGPVAAIAVAILIAVVVFPTPPFWLTTATIWPTRYSGSGTESAFSPARSCSSVCRACRTQRSASPLRGGLARKASRCCSAPAWSPRLRRRNASP